MQFSFGSQHHVSDLHSEANFREMFGRMATISTCFVEVEKAYDRVPRDKVWKVSLEYGADGQLLRAIESFYCRPEVCGRVNGKQSNPFHKGVGLRQGCVLKPLLFIVNMNWIDKCSQANECWKLQNQSSAIR